MSDDGRAGASVLPPLPAEPVPHPLRVIVLTCGDFGRETASVLRSVPHVEVVAIVRAPEARARSPWKRLRNVYRYHGLPGLLRLPGNKLRARLARAAGTESEVAERFVPGFHDPATLAAVREMDVDLAVVDGTYVLKESIFLLPRFGAINIHCGRLPDFRGAPPAFWEMMEGEPQVGITIHRVTAKLDEGPILKQETFPLDVAPPGDPYAYVLAYWRDALRPNAVRLVGEAVAAIARGEAVERPQGPSAHPTFRRPDYATIQRLRRVVGARRR